MNNSIKIGIAAVLLVTLFSCFKSGGPNDIPKAALAISYINGGPWHLVSTTDVSATGSISRYKGLPIDSMNFAWIQGINANIFCTTITTSVAGRIATCNYDMKVLNSLGLVVLCSPAWKDGYSDTLFINANNTTPRSMVFQVRYTDSNGSGLETDSLNR